jgi:hypothetical protein
VNEEKGSWGATSARSSESRRCREAEGLGLLEELRF